MKFKEFGEKNRPAVLLVEDPETPVDEAHIGPALTKDYRIIVPVNDGAEESVKQEAHTVERYIRKHQSGELYAICGTSKRWKLIQAILEGKAIQSHKVIVENRKDAFDHLIVSMLKEFAVESHIPLSSGGASR